MGVLAGAGDRFLVGIQVFGRYWLPFRGRLLRVEASRGGLIRRRNRRPNRLMEGPRALRHCGARSHECRWRTEIPRILIAGRSLAEDCYGTVVEQVFNVSRR